MGGRVLEIHAATMESPIGRLTVAARPEGVIWLGRDATGRKTPIGPPSKFEEEVGRHVETVRWVWDEDSGLTAPVLDALRRYFRGDHDAFQTLPVAPVGTRFQMDVWEACARIPFGKTRSYGDLAADVGRPLAARAVGGAMRCNPIPLIVPCHRILPQGGGLGGYNGGTKIKEWLLGHEGVDY
jgi:methylated-DNA-[protein]-cysteine S-methyltransferase